MLDLSPAQLALLEYISLYESIEEMDPRDKPDEETVLDDNKFDLWIKDFTKRKEMEIRHGGNKGADQHQTVYRFHGVDQEEDYDD